VDSSTDKPFAFAESEVSSPQYPSLTFTHHCSPV